MASLLTVVVVTFNLLHGGPWGEWTGDDQQLERRLGIVVSELGRLRPDVIALQEASVGRRRGNVAARLAERLGMHYVHEPATERVFGVRVFGWLATRLIGFREGPAILSRYPIVASHAIDLPRCRKRYDPRLLLSATLRTPRGDMIVYSTHVSRDDCQIARIAEVVAARPNGLPSVVMGDFNTGDSMEPVARMRASGFIDAFRAANPRGVGATVWQPIDAPTPMASRRVDYIFVLAGHEVGVRVAESRVVLDSPLREPDGSTLWPSDHHGVLATISLVPPRN